MTTSSTLCPCNSQKEYALCCEPVHQDHAHALYPEQLMRARYSAHVLGLLAFIIQTYHPSCSAQFHRDAILESIKNQWFKLDIIASDTDKNGREGFVEFKAYFFDACVLKDALPKEKEEKANCLHEKSRFVMEEKEGHKYWYYIDGECPKTVKVSRNSPCPCGSGKKHKKCCG